MPGAYKSHQDYDAAQAALGVKQADSTEPFVRKYKQFRARSRAAFEAIMEQEGQCTYQHWFRNQHIGYANPDSQALWCAWVEALSCMPSLLKLGPRDAERELGLFVNFRRQRDTTPAVHIRTALVTGTATREARRCWRVWQAALDFGLVTLQQPA